MSYTLHPIEKKVLSALSDKSWKSIIEISKLSGLNADSVRRAVEWLLTKKLIEKRVNLLGTQIELLSYPAEIKVVDEVIRLGGSARLDELKNLLTEEEFTAGIGRARKLGWVELENDWIKVSKIASYSLLKEEVRKVQDGTKHDVDDYIKELARRGLARIKEKKEEEFIITDSGLELLSREKEEYLDNLTQQILLAGTWRGKKLRPINVEAESQKLYPGRRHPVREFIKEVREVYISMGFTELYGNSVQPAFWNFDALFIPQDHPAREMQDTFYLTSLHDNSIELKGVYKKVAMTHESGWKTGSKGWQYVWDVNEARKLLLRTHNTVLTVRALHELRKEELRVFAVSKVYRNENLDYKHLLEFHQMDGIISGKGMNLSHLIGFLKEFYRKLGISDVKLWPTYFPYTEPSLQIMGYSSKVNSWIELGGSGIFRPEVTIPLGVRVPVLAWGPAIERLMLLRYDLDDIRELYNNDLGWLRSRREFASS